VQRAREDSNL